jgi:hypothetical protein
LVKKYGRDVKFMNLLWPLGVHCALFIAEIFCATRSILCFTSMVPIVFKLKCMKRTFVSYSSGRGVGCFCVLTFKYDW